MSGHPYPGFLLTVEGTEGSGKTTALDAIERRLREAGRTVVRVREPGGTPLGEAIRGILFDLHGMEPLPELLLFLASRAALYADVVRPALEAGHAVLCDRSVDSSLVYQGYLGGLPLEEIERLNALATGGIWPDRTLAFLTDYATARRRMDVRGSGGKYDDLDRAGFGAVRDGYVAAAARHPRRIAVIDAGGTPAEVEEAAWAAIPETVRG